MPASRDTTGTDAHRVNQKGQAPPAPRQYRQALQPGGRIAAVVYAAAVDNGFFSVPVSIIRHCAGLGPPLPRQPRPFSLGG